MILRAQEEDYKRLADSYRDIFFPFLDKVFKGSLNLDGLEELLKLYLSAYDFLKYVEENQIKGFICFSKKPYKIWRDLFLKGYLFRWLLKPKYFFLVGTQSLRYMFLPHILWLGVLEEERGEGIGSALLEKAIESLRGEGVEKVYLETLSHSDEFEFYRKQGFEVEEKIKDLGREWFLMSRKI